MAAESTEVRPDIFQEPGRKSFPRQEEGCLDQIRRLQLPQNDFIPTLMVQERSHVWNPRQHTRRTQCHSQDLRQNLIFVLLAKDDSGHQETQKYLPTLATTKKIHQQTDSASASSDSGLSKPPDSCRSFWPNDHSWQSHKNCTLHYRCIH